MDKDLKIPKSYSLDPIVVAWVTNLAAKRTIAAKGTNSTSVSEVVNEILTEAMQRSMAEDDADKAAKMVKRQLLRQK